MHKRLIFIAALAALSIYAATPAQAQTSSGKVTTAAPAYTNNTAAPLSLDTNGNLRVVDAGGGGGTQDTNLIELAGTPLQVTTPGVLDVNVVNSGGGGAVDLTDIGGVPVVSTTPGTLDVTCIAGCVAGVGTVNGQATTAAPSYVNGTPNPLSLDLAGNLRTSILTALPAGTNNIGDVDVLTLPAITGSVTVSGTVAATQSGTWNVGLNAGTNNIGDVDVLTLPSIPAGANAIGTVGVTSLPALADQGTSNFSLIAANSTNATSIKGSAGQVYELSFYNNGSTIAYVKLYNTSGTPTCGSGTPVARYLIPGASSGGAGSNVQISLGKSFSSGIGMCITTGIADADTGAVAASTYLVNVTYK